MSKAFGTLFGKKATPVQTQPTSFQSLPDFGQDLLRDIVTQGQELAGRTDIFTPTAPAALDPFERQAIERLGAGVGLFQPQVAPAGGFRFGQRASDVFSQAGDVLSRAGQPITGEEISTGIGQFFNPFVEQALQPTIRGLREEGMRQASDIGSLASNRGAFGGTRQALLESELGSNLQQNIGDVLSSGYSDAFRQAAPLALNQLQTDRSRGLQSGQALAGLGGDLFGARLGMEDIRSSALNRDALRRNAELQNISNQLQAGGLLRGQEQRLADFGTGVSRIPLNQFDLLRQTFGIIPVGGGGSQLRQNQGALQRIGDSSTGLATIGALLSSDIRIKENIDYVGLENGYPTYEFNYIGKPERYVGVMAQEIKRMKEDAVTDINGVLHVDYGKLGLEMRRVN